VKTYAGVLLCCAVAASACTTTGSQTTNDQDVSFQEDVSLQETVEPVASQELIARNEAYQRVFEQAARHGIVAGALRGAMLGALIDGEAGIVGGAILGAAFGSAYASTTAERLLLEREEFLNRQEIIENILEASEEATERSAEDVAIVSRAVSEWSRLINAQPPLDNQQVGSSISIVRQAAEMRAVLIEELLREAALSPAEQAEVRAALDRQWDSVRQIRAQQELWSAMQHG
jgi:hypothetical protein